MEDDRLPLTRSLEVEVRTGFAFPPQTDGLSGETLLDALSKLSLTSHQTLVDALHEAGHDAIASEPAAILAWIDAVFARWQSRYPLDPKMLALLWATKPLAAAFACREDRFFTPGAHAVHRLLDTLHEGFAGWSGDLGKTAQLALDAVSEVIQRCLQDFPSEPAVDHTLDLLEQKISAHSIKLERLDPGLIEREATAMANTLVRREVADQLSQQVGDRVFPTTLANFLGGNWFDAGVSLIKNLGTGSDLWQQYCRITAQFVLQFAKGSPPDSQTSQAEVPCTPDGLPDAARDVLLEVGVSSDRAQSIAAMLEYLSLRRASEYDHGALSPVLFERQPSSTWTKNSIERLRETGIAAGQWYRIHRPEGIHRLRLSGTFGGNSYLIFMDFTGARALRVSVDDFANLLRSGEAVKLDTQQTFSRALIEAAEERNQLLGQKQAAQVEARDQQTQLAEKEAAERASEREAAAQRLRTAEQRAAAQHDALPTTQSDDTRHAVSAEQPFDPNAILQLKIPIGTWLGFHDREPPIMARVAVRDLDKDSYIFTNRDGIKLRELTVPQLVTLIERDMVDILERKTSFRETLVDDGGRARLGQFQA